MTDSLVYQTFIVGSFCRWCKEPEKTLERDNLSPGSGSPKFRPQFMHLISLAGMLQIERRFSNSDLFRASFSALRDCTIDIWDLR